MENFQDKHSQAERDKWSLTLSYAILQFYPEIKLQIVMTFCLKIRDYY